jgi:Fe-S-cluster containining protein
MRKNAPRSRSQKKRDGDAALFAVTGEDLEARRAQRLRTLAILKTGRTPMEVIQVGAAAEETAATAVAAAREREPPRRPSACVEGCAWCCHKRVGVAVPEVARIAAYVQAGHAPLDSQAILERVKLTLEKRRQGSSGPAPCPLLVNDRCAVYPVRPLTCRGYNSSDPKSCQSSVTDNPRTVVPVYPPQLRLTSLVLDGMRAGLTESGLNGEILELGAALQIALTAEDALAGWLEGKPTFASARLT